MTEHLEQRKDRTFLRAIQSAYNLKDELARLRAIPRVRRAEEVKFIDGPLLDGKGFELHDGVR